MIYKIHNNWVFEFTGSDSTNYHYFSSKYINKSLFEFINHHIGVTKYGIEDIGNIIYITSIYKFINDPIAVRFFNLFMSLFNCYMIMILSKNIFKIKYFSFVTIAFSISSFNIYYISSGLKEIIFISVILSTYCFYYFIILNNKNIIIKTFLFIISILSINLFRMPVFIFSLISFAITNIKYRIFLSILFLILISILFLTTDLLLPLSKYFFKSSENLNLTNLLYSFLSGIFGPFPTYFIQEEFYINNIYAPSLIIKCLISFYFIYALYFIIKNDEKKFQPILYFSLILIFSLIVIFESFKLRYSIIYLPFFYILSGYGIELFEMSNHKYKYVFHNISTLFIFFIVLFWNLLRI
tara:strand:- start:20953 stop:22014 length:1062 start_codon:yes stop_codon:yes gene_type:complete